MSIRPRWSRSSMISPAQVPSTGCPCPPAARSGSASPSRSMPSVITVDSPPGMTSPSSPSRSAGMRTSRGSAPSSRSSFACASKSPWRASTPTTGTMAALPAALGEELRRRPACAPRARSSPRPAPSEARATRSGSSKCVVASTIARARAGGSCDLKIPEPTKTPSAPSCIISDASAGRGDPARAEQRRRAACRRAPPRARGRAARAAPWRRSPARRRPATRGAASRP